METRAAVLRGRPFRRKRLRNAAAGNQSRGIAPDFWGYRGHAGSGGSGPPASSGESSPAQREQEARYGCFDVRGGDTGRHYRIKNGFQLNVQLLDNKGRTTAVLCFMPAGNLVAGDVMLAQKLALELFESDTLKIANKFSVNRYWA